MDELCRICQDDCEQAPFIRPCACRGSVEFSHQNCLVTWLQTSGRTTCEMCHTPFRMQRLGLKPMAQWKCPHINCNLAMHLTLFLLCVVFLVLSVSWLVWSRVVVTRGLRFQQIMNDQGGVMVAIYLPLDLLCVLIAGLEFWFVVMPLHQNWRRRNEQVVLLEYVPGTRYVKTSGDVPKINAATQTESERHVRLVDANVDHCGKPPEGIRYNPQEDTTDYLEVASTSDVSKDNCLSKDYFPCNKTLEIRNMTRKIDKHFNETSIELESFH